MKKKYYAGIMMVAVSMAVTACGGGSKSPKSEVAEISAELEQQMNADDKAAIKEAQAELKEEGRSNTKAEPETETEEEFDPLQVDISVSGINPYEQELFEIFGLDNNFPSLRIHLNRNGRIQQMAMGWIPRQAKPKKG